MSAVIERRRAQEWAGVCTAAPGARSVRRVQHAPRPSQTPRRRGVDRSGVWRRPAGAPASVPRRATAVSRASHAPVRGMQHPAGIRAIVAITILLAVFIFAAAQVRSIGAVTVPDAVATVEVASGDTLSSIAHEVAPDVPVNQVVDRIIALNGLDGPAVYTGQSLMVPAAQGR